MFERFTQSSRTAVRCGVEEAERRGDRRIGTDHLLLGLLHDKEAAALLGVSVADARASADDLDRKALAAIGIDVGDFRPVVAPRVVKHTPFTSGARAVMARTLAHTAAEKSRRIMPRHLLLALLELEQPDPAAALLRECKVSREEVARKLTESAG
jgi:ATP-dependent Clp protease ATP-binding subunit ClpA